MRDNNQVTDRTYPHTAQVQLQISNHVGNLLWSEG